ncbi:MAG: hypothetical protein NTX72_00545 [Candidatus Uhrbacteria bacterium]|nr:hypothetical protein [Candidatus Uhrbacteria bacterium]
MNSGLKHLRARARASKQLEPVPNPKAFIRFVDRFAYLSIIVPILTIPQFITIFVHHNASDLSLVTWGTYLISACYWTYYGWLHKEMPIWFPNSLMILVDLGVVIGILMYK